MILKEFFWKKKKNITTFMNTLGLMRRSITLYSSRSTTPGVLSALKIYVGTNKEISFVDLLSDKDLDSFHKFLQEYKFSEKNHELVLEMFRLIKETKESRELQKDE